MFSKGYAMKTRLLASAIVLFALPVSAATFPDNGTPNGGVSQGAVVQYRDGTAYTNSNIPVSPTNPLPVSITGSGTNSLVGVKGADGSTISSTTNPLPDVPTPSSAVGVGLSQCFMAIGTSSIQCGTATQHNLYVVYGEYSSADTYVYIFNSTSAPTSPSTPTYGFATGNYSACFKVPSGTSVSEGGIGFPITYTNGMYLAASSTSCGTFTAATTANVKALYK